MRAWRHLCTRAQNGGYGGGKCGSNLLLVTVSEAIEALDQCDAALAKLSESCCEPGRSPRMSRLGETLKGARSQLTESDSPSEAIEVIARLADAGAQLGGLQVECCAPSRMPLYAGMLEHLMVAQRAVTKAYALSH